MLDNNGLGGEIDLPGKLIPQARPAAPVREEPPASTLRLSLPDAELSEDPGSRQPHRRRRFACRRRIAASDPRTRMRHHLGSHRIQRDVATEFQQMRVCLHENRGKAPLQHLPYPPIRPVIGLRVPAVQRPHVL